MTLDELRGAIEQHFWVHQTQGDHSTCATGEPYVTYCLGVKGPRTQEVDEFLVGAMLTTLLCLRYGCVPSKEKGTSPVVDTVPPVDFYGDMRGTNLYWRSFPEIDNDKGITVIRCRAKVSKARSDGEQLLPPVLECSRISTTTP